MLVTGMQQLMSLQPKGTFGFTSAVGFARCGYSKCGASKEYGGIYQRKKTLKGWRVSRMRYYRPSNPQTETQQSWRAVFTAGWEAYNLLSPEEKVLLYTQAQKYGISGPNLFMRRWLHTHR